MFVGAIFAPAGYLLVFGTLIYWYTRQKYEFFIIAFILFLILADARSSGLGFVQSLRIPLLFFLMFFALEAMYRGVFGVKKLFFYSLPFFATAFFCLLFSPVFAMGFAKTASYFFLIFIVLHYWPYIIIKTRSRILVDVAYFITFFATGALITYVVYPAPVTWHPGTPMASYKGMFSNPNGLGLYSTLMVPFTFIMSHIFVKKKKLLYFATTILTISAFLADSRTAMGCLLFFFIFYFFYVYFRNTESVIRRRIGKWATRILWFVFIPMGVAILVFIGVSDLVIMLGLGEVLEVQTIDSGAGRFVAWQHAIEGIEKNGWWIGRGFHYDVQYFRDMKDILAMLGHSGGTHNSYLSLILDVGLLGLICFLFFLGMMLKQIKGEAKNFIVPYLVVILFSSNFEAWLASSINYVTIFFYLTIILLIYFDEFKAAHLEEYKDKLKPS